MWDIYVYMSFTCQLLTAASHWARHWVGRECCQTDIITFILTNQYFCLHALGGEISIHAYRGEVSLHAYGGKFLYILWWEVSIHATVEKFLYMLKWRNFSTCLWWEVSIMPMVEKFLYMLKWRNFPTCL